MPRGASELLFLLRLLGNSGSFNQSGQLFICFQLETVSHHKRGPINKASHYDAGRFLHEGTVCLRGLPLIVKTLMWKIKLKNKDFLAMLQKITNIQPPLVHFFQRSSQTVGTASAPCSHFIFLMWPFEFVHTQPIPKSDSGRVSVGLAGVWRGECYVGQTVQFTSLHK